MREHPAVTFLLPVMLSRAFHSLFREGSDARVLSGQGGRELPVTCERMKRHSGLGVSWNPFLVR